MQRYKDNPQGTHDRAKIWKKEHPERWNTIKAKSARKWRKENPEKAREEKKKHSDRARKNLTDYYVKGSLVNGSNLSRADIPQELIELQRISLKLKRATRGV